jgi:capsular polysaccharide biosynthesis protein
MQSENNIIFKVPLKQDFSLREFVMKYFHVVPWAIVTISISIGIAYLKIRYTNPIFQASGKIIVKSENNGRPSQGKFSELYMMQSGGNDFEDQIELIRSSSLARLVVETVGLQMQYFYIGSFRTTAIHKPASPIECIILKHPDSSSSFSLQIRIGIDVRHLIPKRSCVVTINLIQPSIRVVDTFDAADTNILI